MVKSEWLLGGGNSGCTNSMNAIVFKNSALGSTPAIEKDWILSCFATSIYVSVTKKEYNRVTHDKNGTFNQITAKWPKGGAADNSKYATMLLAHYTGLSGLIV